MLPKKANVTFGLASFCILCLIASPIAASQCSGTYALNQFDYGGRNRYQLAHLQLQTPGVAYVKETKCPDEKKMQDYVNQEYDCTAASVTGVPQTISGCAQSNHHSPHRPESTAFCCPRTHEHLAKVKYKTAAGEEVTAHMCFSWHSTYPYELVAATDPTTNLVKYSDFFKNGGSGGSFGSLFKVSITGCAETSPSTTTCNAGSGTRRRLPWDEERSNAFGREGRRLEGGSGPQILPLAPFSSDTLANYFRYNSHSDGVCAYSLKPDQAYTAFSSVSTKKTVSGECAMFVTLEEDEDPKTEQEELVSVDGVALSCLTGLGVPYVKLALNVIPALLQSTGAAPSGEETITVVTKKSNGELRTRSTNMTYAKYEALEAEFRALKDSGFDRMPQCWTSSVLDNVRVWDCETTATTCVRTDVTRAKNDPKAIAYESLKDGIVPLLMIIDATDLRTGQPMGMGPGGSADYDWESGKCQIAVEGLYDAGGNEICNADKPTTPTFTEPMCAYNGMKEAHNKLNSLMDKMSKGKMKNDPTEVTAITSTDNWFACVNLVKKMQKEGTVEKSRETASCILSYPDTCGKSTREFCESNPSNEWCNDPCCNWEKSRTMCCAPTKRTFQARVYEVLPDEVAKRCANDPSISKSEASAFLASAIVSAQSFVDASTKPEVCFEDFDERGKAIEKIRNAPKCCFEAIVDDGYSWRISKSIQFCEDDSDCFSGKCVDTGVNTPQQTTKDCFEAGEYEGKTKVCQLINGPSAAEPLGKCLLKLLSAYPKASRLVKNVFADGDKNDKGAKVGNGIFNLASVESCDGPQGYKYDPRNWCQEYKQNSTTGKWSCERNCEGAACETQCLSKKTCSENNVPKNSCTGGSFCGKEHSWQSGYTKEVSRATAEQCTANVCTRNKQVFDSITTAASCTDKGGECTRPFSHLGTKADCEAAGRCEGGVPESWYDNHGHSSITRAHVCVFQNTDYESCQNYNVNSTGGRCIGGCWDSMVRYLWRSESCAVARLGEVQCNEKGGIWKSTAYNASSCLAAKRCREGYWENGKDQEECEKCGGHMVSTNKWITPNWIEPKWEQSSMLQWVDKEMISENKWEKRLEGWRFENSFRRITDTFEDERGITFTACMVGKQAHALETISGICGAGDAPPSAEILGLISGCVETAKVNLLQDVEETVGNIKTSNIQVRADTLPSTSTESAITLCEESYIPGFGGEAKGRRLGSKGDTMNSADCYTVVKNTKGKLVGQLVGDCLEVSSAVTPFANPATLCLKLKDEIEINAKFTEYDFAVRTSSSSGTYDYASKEFSTSPSGDNICADILKNAVYCPISRVPTPESVTEDQGGETCNALNNIVDQVQEKKAAIKCKAGDSVSCKWMEPGSTSFYLGVGGIIVIIIGAIIFVQATYCAHKHRHVLKKHLTKKFFDSIDKDGNGTLDAGEIQIMLEHEFGASVSSTQVKRLMKKFGTKEMDFETYLKFVEYLKGVGTDNEGIEMKDILEKKVWKRKSMVELTVKDNGDREFVNPLGAHKPKRTRRVSRNSWELKNAAKRAEKIKSDAVRKSTPSNVAVEVPPAWEKLLDAASGNNYFHNLNTGETAWELPAGAKVRGATRKTKQFI